jgi:hypothetical protein
VGDIEFWVILKLKIFKDQKFKNSWKLDSRLKAKQSVQFSLSKFIQSYIVLCWMAQVTLVYRRDSG